MTGRTKIASRLEMEIEKNREEGNWNKVIELADQLKDKSVEAACLSNFLIGEAKLENYLEEWPPNEQNIHRSKMGLAEAKKYLNLAISNIEMESCVWMDSHLLLGKLQYACGQYAESLKCYKMAKLQNLPKKKLPLRGLKIVAESYAIKGLCLQKQTSACSKFKNMEREEELIKCFNLASDLVLLYMQKLEKEINSTTIPNFGNTGNHSPQPVSPHKPLGDILEQAVQAAPIALLQQGKTVQAIGRYRSSLSAVESEGMHIMRLKFMIQMAELFLQGLVGNKHQTPVTLTTKILWKPEYYSFLNQFLPKCECEETLLVLLIAETMAVRNAVLSQSPEFEEARLSAFRNASTVYDLLTIATVRWSQIGLLQESLERSMKFSFEEPHLWKQDALALLSIGNYQHALAVLKEVIRLESNNSSNLLLAAKICYENLNAIEDGLEFSFLAREKELNNPTDLLGRCHLYIGIGYHLLSEIDLLMNKKESLRCKALDNIRTAVELEPNDHLSRYYYGLQLAITGQMTEAKRHIKIGLDLNPEHSSTLHLLILILTAEKQYRLALLIIENTLEEYPDSLNLYYLKVLLELNENGGEVALTTAKEMLVIWKNLYNGQTISDFPECDKRSDSRSVFQLYTSGMSDKDSSSLQFQNIAVSKAEHALSEVASSLSNFSPKPGPHKIWLLQVEIWLLIAELYLTLNEETDALRCIHEADQIYPSSHHIMHMKGLFHMHKKEWMEAKICLQNAIAINPIHVKSLQQLGLVYHYLDLHSLAEMTLREAVKIEPHNPITWYNLGKVLESLGEYEKASDAMAAALTEESHRPILPFNSVSLCFE